MEQDKKVGRNMSKQNKKRKLKIAMLGHKRVPSREGGIEVVVEELATRMVKMGHEVTCYNRRGHHVSGRKYDIENRHYYKGIRLKKVFTIEKRGLAAMTSSFFAAIRTAFNSYDVVHFHAEGPCAMIWLPKLLGKHCVATIHGLDHQRAKWGKFAQWYILLGEKMAVKYADEIIVLSRGVQRYFWDTYKRKTKFIPNGVNVPEKKEANIITMKFNLVKDDYILYVGRLVPEKGLEYLIKAFKMIKTSKKLVIAGGASDTNEFEQRLRYLSDTNENIIFTGFVQGEILEELYSNAYIYVLPSDLEGMSLSLLEAMSYGNCCMVSDIEECSSVIQENGITFKKGNILDLKKKLQVALESEEKVKEIRNKSAEFICNKYNWDDITNKTLGLYY